MKKIAKEFHKQIKLEKDQERIKQHDYSDWSEYDSEVSDKFKEMFIQLIEYKDNLNIILNSSSISVSVLNIKKLKSNSNSTYSEEDFLEINIKKNIGYSIVRGYNKRSQYKDKDIFNLLENIVKDRLLNINRENFNDVWKSVMIDSGLVRDNNLLNILKKD